MLVFFGRGDLCGPRKFRSVRKVGVDEPTLTFRWCAGTCSPCSGASVAGVVTEPAPKSNRQGDPWSSGFWRCLGPESLLVVFVGRGLASKVATLQRP